MARLIAWIAVAATGFVSGDRPDASLLKTGEFLYRGVQQDRTLGQSDIVVAREPDGRYRFSNTTAGYADQKWTAVTRTDFTPISAILTFGGDGDRHEIFDIRYAGGRVSGLRYPRRPAGAGAVPVEDIVDVAVIDQRIDWAAVMARRLAPGARFTFQVYDPAIATSAGTATVEDGGRIHVPAGDFDTFKVTYRIEKKTGAEQYVVFATKALPRFLVREDFPDGLSSLLEKAS